MTVNDFIKNLQKLKRQNKGAGEWDIQICARVGYDSFVFEPEKFKADVYDEAILIEGEY